MLFYYKFLLCDKYHFINQSINTTLLYLKKEVMENLEQKSVTNIVLNNINTTKVFEKYNIDFGFKGDNKLNQVCKTKNLDVNDLIRELEETDKKKFYLKDYNSWPIELLVDFLTDIQHTKKKEDLFILKNLNNSLNKKNENNKELINIFNTFKTITKLLLSKISDEENNIYPYIKELVAIDNGNINKQINNPYLLKNIERIEKNRVKICRNLEDFIRLINTSTKIIGKDPKVFLLFNRGKTFYYFLQEHNHIEKNILLPKALLLEEKLLK